MKALAVSLGLVLVSSVALAQNAARPLPLQPGGGSPVVPAPANLQLAPNYQSGAAETPVPAMILEGGAASQRHSSTLQEGVGRSYADILRSAGIQTYLKSLAARNFADAQRMQIENAPRYVAAHFQCHSANQQFRAQARGGRPDAAALARIAKAGVPPRLAPHQLNNQGRVSWPMLLQSDQYAECRAELDELFLNQAVAGRPGLADYRRMNQLTATMLETLKADIRSVSPTDYIAARRFLTGVATEIRLFAARPVRPGAAVMAQQNAASRENW